MVVEEMMNSDFCMFVEALNEEIPLGTNYKVFNTIDDNYHKVICFYSNPRDFHPIAILKIGNHGCEFSDDYPNFDSMLASNVLKSFLSNHNADASLGV